MAFKFELDEKVTCIVGGKYMRVPENAPGKVTDRYQSTTSGEIIYEVEFGYAYVLIREMDLKKL